MILPGTTTLEQAKHWLRARYEHGERCPLCNQYVKLYRRQVNAQMVRALILLAREGREFAHWPTILHQNGVRADEAKLRYWDLVEEDIQVRPDGGRAGWWRITPRGWSFIRGGALIQKYALIYDTRLMGFDGPAVSIHDCIGKAFDLQELMSNGNREHSARYDARRRG